MNWRVLGFAAFLLVLATQVAVPVEGLNVVMGCIYPLTGPQAVEGAQEEALMRLAVADINNNIGIQMAPNNSLSYRVLDSESTETGTLDALSQIGQVIVVFSSHSSETVRVMAPVVQARDLPHYCVATSETLTDPSLAFLSRVVPSDRFQGIALADFVVQYNWGRTVATLSTSDIYGSTILNMFSKRLNYLGYSLLASQQFGSGSTDLWPYLDTVKKSHARVIANFMPASDMREVLRHAERFDMLHTSRYVWLCSDACANTDLFVDEATLAEGGTQIDWKTRNRAEGMIGTRLRGGYGPQFEEFLQRWQSLDPQQYAGAGQPQLASFYAPYVYDSVYAYSYALLVTFLDEVPNNYGLMRHMNATDFVGLTGRVTMDVTGRIRMPEYDIVNLAQFKESWLKDDEPMVPQTDFAHVGTWNILKGPEKLKIRKESANDYTTGGLEGRIELNWAIQWGDGTSDTPNLDLRNSVDYWSCDDKEMKTDENGRSIRLDKPDGGNGNIADYYRCDEYIDCYNLSDEWGCAVSFPVTFIVYGIFIFLLLLFAILCLVFTCVFGFCIGRRRVRAASPVFLIIMTLSCILGYLGLFSFFGQPEQVSCGFRIWIIALSVVIMISALFAKSFRIWRLYRSPTEIKAMRDWKLIIFVVVLVLPVIVLLVLWTGLATPGAELKKQNDDHEHFVCVTGGVAENAGSYTFFALIVAYIGLILLFGTFLSVVTRNVVSTFNESRLIAVSIYNLVFLGVVVIPIYFVLQDSGPLVAWIIIVTAVLYGLSATLFLQFLPKMYGVFVRDRLADISSHTSTEGANESNLSKTLDSKAIW